MSSILPRNEQKQLDLRYHSSYVESFRSFLGKFEDTKKTFRNQLTFNHRKIKLIMSSSQKFDVEVDQSPSMRNSRPVQKYSPLRQVDQNSFHVNNKVTLDNQNAHKFDCKFG